MEEQNALPPGAVAVVGLPYDEGSSFLRGSRLAPAKIREVLNSGSCNWTSELGLDLGAHSGWAFVADLDLEEDAHSRIEAGIEALLERGLRPLSLGGDHSVTYPVLKAVGPRHPGLTVVQIDAHPDLHDQYEGDRHSHACPFARTLEEGLIDRLVQIGIRTLDAHQAHQAERFGVQIFRAREWSLERLPRIEGPVYLSLDLDALDPAFAPGVSHHEPGGLSSRDVLTIIQHLPGELVGADIVELNPRRDLVDMTAMVAAKCLKEILAKMLG